MKIKVIHTAFEEVAVHIATVDAPEGTIAEQLEYAYRWTQNIQDSWSKKMEHDGNDRVTVEVPLTLTPEGREYGHRSTSVGDYCEVAGQLWRVAGMGFEPASEIKVGHPL